MKGLREVTAAIFNSLEWEHKKELRGVNGKLHVNGIHIARHVLIILVRKYKPQILEQAAVRQTRLLKNLNSKRRQIWMMMCLE